MGSVSFIPSLTPLRGIAAMLVVFFHFHLMIGPLTTPDNYVISKLYLMVDLFFVLSGFIMAHVYGDYFSVKIQKKSFLKFMKARFARLYPLHLITFIYVFILVIYMKSQIDFNQTPVIVQNVLDNSAIFGVLTLTQAWGTHMEATWNSASWSISVEWFLYLIFPFLAYLINKYKRNAVVFLGVLSLLFLFVICYYIEPQWIESISKMRENTEEQLAFRSKNSIDIITGFALLRGLGGFIFGMIAYTLYENNKFEKVLEKWFWFPASWLLLFLCWVNDMLLDPFAILIFSIMILHSAYAKGRLKRILNNRVFTYLGDISYSIYMVHIPILLTFFIISLIKGEMPPPPEKINYTANWIGAFIFLLIVIALASFTYWFVEKPARKKLKNL